MNERIQQLEQRLNELVEATANLQAASSATYALNRCVLSSLIGALKVSGTDTTLFTTIFFETATDLADDMEGEKRRIFLAELKAWLDLLHSSA